MKKSNSLGKGIIAARTLSPNRLNVSSQNLFIIYKNVLLFTWTKNISGLICHLKNKEVFAFTCSTGCLLKHGVQPFILQIIWRNANYIYRVLIYQ